MSDNILKLSDLTTEFGDFKDQLQAYLAAQTNWSGTLTTQTSTTLVDLMSTIGAFATSRIYRVSEDAFSETAISDSSIRSIAQMQGLRMTRKLPASIPATITSPINTSLPSLTQFTVGNAYYFNRDPITFVANTPKSVTLFEGQVMRYATNGLGTPSQTWISTEDSFTVSDQDVQVDINGTIIPKAFGGLWNYSNLPAYADLTLPDGRLVIQFGNQQFGITPQVSDVVTMTYPVTSGADGNNKTLNGKIISVSGFSQISGTVTSNPTGGSDETPVIAYKNLGAGSFGTYQSAVTGSQYKALVGTYPGIVDAVTQAQREIDPTDYKLMNTIRVSTLTSSPWSGAQKNDFLKYLQSITMYAPYFILEDAVAIPRDINVSVYCFNSVVLGDIQQVATAAVQQLFAAKPGILLTNHYPDDISDAIKAAAPGKISYIIVNDPTGPMKVTAPDSPLLSLTQLEGSGTLGSLVYSYGISTIIASGEEGPPTNWAFTAVSTTTPIYAIQLDWEPNPDAAHYHIWGRAAGSLGLLATVDGDVTTWVDDGSITPTGGPPNTIPDVPIRYNQLRNLTVNVYYAERQQRLDGTPYRNQQ